MNNASAEFGKRFEHVTENEWSMLMDFNVKSVYLTCQAVGRRMLKQRSGRIVNMSERHCHSAVCGTRLRPALPRGRFTRLRQHSHWNGAGKASGSTALARVDVDERAVGGRPARAAGKVPALKA